MADKRCGRCPGCRATPPRPCRWWIDKAVKRLKRELESPEMRKAIMEALGRQDEADCEQCGRGTTRRIDGLAVCVTCVPSKDKEAT